MEKSDIVIKVRSIKKTYSVRENPVSSVKDIVLGAFKKNEKRNICALRGVDFEVKKGECFGIIGNNGSGKSTLMNIIMGFIRPDKGGQVSTIGKMMRLELGMGVDNNLSARDNIYVNGSVLGLSFKQIGDIFDDIIEFADLHEFVDTPVKFYSKGMKSRLLFSIAMHAEADIFLLDEFFGGVGDEDFKRKSDEAFNQKILDGKTIVIISHSLAIIKKHCSKCLWLSKGEIKGLGKTEEVVAAYQKSQNTKKMKSKKKIDKITELGV